MGSRVWTSGRKAILAVFLLSFGCAGYVDVAPKAIGGVENPILCHLPEGERFYLKKLRTPDGGRVHFEYLDAVLGPEGRVLDRFSVANPAHIKSRRSLWAEFLDLLRTDPLLPRAFRIYLDMYHPGVEDGRVPSGFTAVPVAPASPAGNSPAPVPAPTAAENGAKEP